MVVSIMADRPAWQVRQPRSEEHRESDKDGEREKERGGELTLKQHNKETTLQRHRRLHFMFLNNSRS